MSVYWPTLGLIIAFHENSNLAILLLSCCQNKKGAVERTHSAIIFTRQNHDRFLSFFLFTAWFQKPSVDLVS